MNANSNSLVQQINKKYETLKTISSDNLRESFDQLKTQATSSVIETEAFLIEVFAIVKEVTRRFASGEPLIVTATSSDVAFSKELDGLNIKKKEAIYTNSWTCCGESFVWNMIPYDEQIYAGIELHKGHIIEMATGEGKTLVAIFPAILNSMTGKGVHLMTVNGYLSRRDFEMTRPIYAFLGLHTQCIEGLRRASFSLKEAYRADVTFGKYSNFVFDYLFDHISTNIEQCVQTELNYAILDEVDSVLIDQAQTPHIISNNALSDEDENNYFKSYLPLVEELINKKFYKADITRKTATCTADGISWLKSEKAELALEEEIETEKQRILKAQQYSTQQKQAFLSQQKVRTLELQKRWNAIDQLLLALTVYQKDVDYIIESDKVVIIDPNTGRPLPTHHWDFGLHEAIEAKEHLNSKVPLNSISARITVKNYLKFYGKLSGMTGTALSAAAEIKETYGLDVVAIARHLLLRRQDKKMRIFKSKSDEYQALIREVKNLQVSRRPVLIGVNTIRKSEELFDWLKSQGVDAQLLNAKSLTNEARCIAKAGSCCSITIATSVAGRGTDIKPTEEALRCGGLAVLGVGMAFSKRIDEQLRGRSGRQGNVGTSQFFVSAEDEILEYLTTAERAEINNFRFTEEGEILEPSAQNIWVRAQDIRETENSKHRHLSNQYDDTLELFRKDYYQRRMDLLKPHPQLSNLLENLLSNHKSDKCKINEKLQLIAKEIIPYTHRCLHNRLSTDPKQFFPLTDGDKVYVVECNLEKILQSNGKHFTEELTRVILLQTMDKHWLHFLNAINNNHIHATDIPDCFHIQQQQMIQEIIDLFMKSQLPVYKVEKPNDNLYGNSFDFDAAESETLVKANELCPCGSGKIYALCHGHL